MTRDPGKNGPAKGDQENREDRLKAALKANMARRKAQARARQDASAEKAPGRAERE